MNTPPRSPSPSTSCRKLKHPHRSSARRLTLIALSATATLSLLVGCSSTNAGPTTARTGTATSTATTASSTPSPADSASTEPSARPTGTTSTAPTFSTTKTDPNAPAGQCPDSALAVSVQHNPDGDGAGQRGAFVVFRNTSRSSCRLEGTPGLSLVGGGNGTQIGKPAERTTQTTFPVSIAPGKYALANVTYTYVDKNGGNFSDGEGHNTLCQAKPADGYRVYPPHSYRAYFTLTKTYACSTDVRWISVGPVKNASEYKYFSPKA